MKILTKKYNGLKIKSFYQVVKSAFGSSWRAQTDKGEVLVIDIFDGGLDLGLSKDDEIDARNNIETVVEFNSETEEIIEKDLFRLLKWVRL